MANSKKSCPLWQRADKRWCKKIRGRVHYFGTDKEAALAEWDRVGDDLLAGREPRKAIGYSVADVCNRFLTAKQQAVELGELSPETFKAYLRTCKELTTCFGRQCPVGSLTPQDFARLRASMGGGRAASTLRLRIKKARVVFRWAFESELIERPARYGKSFDAPTEQVLARQREETGERLFSAEQIRWMIDNASTHLRPLVYLGINAAFGPTDVARIQTKHIDLDGGWVNLPRSKTGTNRRAKLWPETVSEIESWLQQRPEPADPQWRKNVFLTSYRKTWELRGRYAPVVRQFRLLLQSGDMWQPRNTFYTLRRTFRTVADEVRDDPAIDLVMGHKTPGMGSVYLQRIDDLRLIAVTERVRKWLFGAVVAEETDSLKSSVPG